MKFRQDKSKPNKNLYFFVAISLFILFYFFSSVLEKTSYDVLATVARPLWSASSALSEWVRSINVNFSSKNDLARENEQLKVENSDLRLAMLSNEVLVNENSELKKMLSNGHATSSLYRKSILAYVLSSATPPYASLLLDQGYAAGILVGDKVIGGPNILLGEITDVYKYSSRAILYSAYGVTLPVILDVGKPLPVTAVGYGGGDFYVELQKDVEIKSGMIVSVPGPEHLVIGVVGDVVRKESSASQEILFKYPINVNQLGIVRIIKAEPK